jgi:tetratricopeptide (TPR) repeat protein
MRASAALSRPRRPATALGMRRLAGAPLAAAALCGLVALPVACEREPEPGSPASSASARPVHPCSDGRSVDPRAAQLSAARAAFHRRDYRKAQQLLEGLIRRHPHSATLLVARADAALYEYKLSHGRARYVASADRALLWYRRAEKLHDQGCRLPERDHYYLRMGAAYAYLRKNEPEPALLQLRIARQRWPDSAEVAYHMARAFCLLGNVDQCVEHFATTLEIASQLRRPRFLRTYHSVDDWLRRAEKQSEFGPLRRSPRYRALVRRARGPVRDHGG